MCLYTKNKVEGDLDQLEEWQAHAYLDFSKMMTDTSNPYPCVPGVQGFLNDTLRFGFAKDPRSDSASEQLGIILKTYGSIARETGKYASLVVFFDSRTLHDEGCDVNQYEEVFWDLLNNVHQLDEEPWPEDIPKDPHHHEWEFCFNGEPYFAFCATPSHSVRKSRKFPYFMVAFQPRWVFDEINDSTTFGQKLKKAIRKRLVKYDGIPPHPDLKWYGNKDNHEWKQYYLSDDESSPSKCPFTNMKNKLKSLRP